MKLFLLAATIVPLLISQARAADAELSTDTKRMLAYGTLAVMTGACKTAVTPDQAAQISTGLQKASVAQHEMNEAQFTETMKAVGAQVGQNKDQICNSLTPEFITSSLEDAAAGE